MLELPEVDAGSDGSGAIAAPHLEAETRIAAMEKELSQVKRMLEEKKASSSVTSLTLGLREEKRLRLEAESSKKEAEELLAGMRSSLSKATAARQMLFDSLKCQTRERCKVEAEAKELRKALDDALLAKEAAERGAEIARADGGFMADLMQKDLKRRREEHGSRPDARVARGGAEVYFVEDSEGEAAAAAAAAEEEAPRGLQGKHNDARQGSTAPCVGMAALPLRQSIDAVPHHHSMGVVPSGCYDIDHHRLCSRSDLDAVRETVVREKALNRIKEQKNVELMAELVQKSRALEEAEALVEELREQLMNGDSGRQHPRGGSVHHSAAERTIDGGGPASSIDSRALTAMAHQQSMLQPYSWKRHGGFEKDCELPQAYSHPEEPQHDHHSQTLEAMVMPFAWPPMIRSPRHM